MTIFYADDDHDEVSLFCDILKKLDPLAECITANDGQQALQVLSRCKPDMIFLDVHMPKLDGKECLKIIKQDVRLKMVPVVVYSSNDDERLVNYYKQLGAKWFLNKKSNIIALQEDLRLILDTTRCLQEGSEDETFFKRRQL